MRAFRAISHPNVLDGHPQHLRQRHPRIEPMPSQSLCPARHTVRGLPASETRTRDAREVLRKRALAGSPINAQVPL